MKVLHIVQLFAAAAIARVKSAIHPIAATVVSAATKPKAKANSRASRPSFYSVICWAILMTVAGSAFGIEPNWKGYTLSLGGFFRDEPAHCSSLGTPDAAKACACTAQNAAAVVCPGRWVQQTSTSNIRDDFAPNGMHLCTWGGTACSNSAFEVDAEPQCPAGYFFRAVEGQPFGSYSNQVCIPISSNPPPVENPNRGQPDVADQCPTDNPVNPATGNKLYAELDYVSFGSSKLQFERFYNSDRTTPRASLGGNWRHTYDRTVIEGGADMYAHRPDGRSDRFVQAGSFNNWTSPTRPGERLTRLFNSSNATTGWVLQTNNDDEQETYDAKGRLISITSRGGLVTTLTYSSASTPPE